jgi:hypothetical protein
MQCNPFCECRPPWLATCVMDSSAIPSLGFTGGRLSGRVGETGRPGWVWLLPPSAPFAIFLRVMDPLCTDEV